MSYKLAIVHFFGIESFPLYGLLGTLFGTINRSEVLSALEFRERMETDLGSTGLTCTERMQCVQAAVTRGMFILSAEYGCAGETSKVPRQMVYSAIILWVASVVFFAILVIRSWLFLRWLPCNASYESGEYMMFTWSLHRHPLVRAYKFVIVAFPGVTIVAVFIYQFFKAGEAGYIFSWFVSILPLVAIACWSCVSLYATSPSPLKQGSESFKEIGFCRPWSAVVSQTNEGFVTDLLLAVAKALAGEAGPLAEMVPDKNDIRKLMAIYQHTLSPATSQAWSASNLGSPQPSSVGA